MKRNTWVVFFSIAVAICLLFGIHAFIEAKNPGFSIAKIRSPFESRTRWAIPPLSDVEDVEVHAILSQDFNYLGSGAECYAFQSADCNYVLKFFRMKHLVPKNWLKWVPLPGLGKYRFRKIDKRILRHQELFSSYKTAFDELRDETGLVYIHLNKSKDLHIKVNLYDRMRKKFPINLDRYEFILQKKGLLVHEKITALMQKGDLEGALEAIRALLEHVVVQCKKGFVDRDSGVSHNYGFVGDRVIHFDVGRIMRDDKAAHPAHYQREVLRVGKKIENWLSVQYPDLLPYLEEMINALIDPSYQK